MAGAPLVLAIDQGTTGTTCLLVDLDQGICRRSYREVAVAHPRPGWVEQDAEALWRSVVEGAKEVLDGEVPAAIGITNQRETLVVFERATLRPVAPAIVWQCRRSAEVCAAHRAAGEEAEIRRRTGLLLDPYFTATKLEWLLRDRPELRSRAERGELCAGTVDAWLVARLTGGEVVASDASNASRTLLYDLALGDFAPDLCDLFGIPRALLPTVCPSAGRVATTDPRSFLGVRVPVTGIAGDQQAALFGQACLRPGMSKATYGTGTFVLSTIGESLPPPPAGLLTTVAWRLGTVDTFALEGSILVSGAAITWLRDQLQLIREPAEVGALVDSVPDSNGCIVVPAFVGLGAPYWDPDARGAILGLTFGVTRAHLVRAVVEAMAFCTRDVVEAMEQAAGLTLDDLRVDGGVSVVDGLCQFLADLLGIPVSRAATAETTGLGAAWLAAVGEGLLDGPQGAAERWRPGRRFHPARPGERPVEAYARWRDAVARVRGRSTELP